MLPHRQLPIEVTVRLRHVIAAAASAVLLSGCAGVPEGAVSASPLVCPPGSEGCDPIQPVGPGGTVTMDMGNFFFTVTDAFPVTGAVEVTVVNVSDAYHNAQFLGAADGSEIPEADGNQTGVGTVLLFPGEWTVICTVPGHRAAGMETTITVYASQDEADAARDAAPAGMGG
jgi:plastocyanin